MDKVFGRGWSACPLAVVHDTYNWCIYTTNLWPFYSHLQRKKPQICTCTISWCRIVPVRSSCLIKSASSTLWWQFKIILCSFDSYLHHFGKIHLKHHSFKPFLYIKNNWLYMIMEVENIPENERSLMWPEQKLSQGCTFAPCTSNWHYTVIKSSVFRMEQILDWDACNLATKIISKSLFC